MNNHNQGWQLCRTRSLRMNAVRHLGAFITVCLVVPAMFGRALGELSLAFGTDAQASERVQFSDFFHPQFLDWTKLRPGSLT